MLSTGTAWALYTVSDAPRFHPRELGIIYCHAMPNRWAALTAHSGGCVLDAFLRQFCNAGDNPDYASHVRKENLCEDLIVIPYMFGANSPENDPAARAAILNLGAHHTPGNVAMAIIESIGFETRRNLDVLAEMDIAFDAVKMAGGACRSDVWPQIVADICNIRVDVIENADTAPLGAAFLAGRAMRLWKQDRLPEYPAMRAFTPETERSKKLDKKFRRYMNAVDLERQRRRNDGQETS